MAQSSVITIKTTIKYFMKGKYIALIFMCIFVLNMRRFFSEFMRCFSSVFVRHFTPSIPYAIPPTAPPIIPPTISLYIRPSVPLSVSPLTCIERSKQGVTFNRELFALIGGVFVFCSFALGNHWSLKNQLGSEKERQESISKEILAKLKEQKEVNEVNEAIEVVNEINEVNE